jgi:DNA-binding protein H-NS
MAQTYQQMLRQIETLQREADEARREEVSGVVERIKEAIKVYGLTAADLGFGDRPKTASSRPAKGVPKFADGLGNSWSGRGKRPTWFKNALASGRTAEDLKVKE